MSPASISSIEASSLNEGQTQHETWTGIFRGDTLINKAGMRTLGPKQYSGAQYAFLKGNERRLKFAKTEAKQALCFSVVNRSSFIPTSTEIPNQTSYTEGEATTTKSKDKSPALVAGIGVLAGVLVVEGIGFAVVMLRRRGIISYCAKNKTRDRTDDKHDDMLPNAASNVAGVDKSVANHNYFVLEKQTDPLGNDDYDHVGGMGHATALSSSDDNYSSAVKFAAHARGSVAELDKRDDRLINTYILTVNSSLINSSAEAGDCLTYYYLPFQWSSCHQTSALKMLCSKEHSSDKFNKATAVDASSNEWLEGNKQCLEKGMFPSSWNPSKLDNPGTERELRLREDSGEEGNMYVSTHAEIYNISGYSTERHSEGAKIQRKKYRLLSKSLSDKTIRNKGEHQARYIKSVNKLNQNNWEHTGYCLTYYNYGFQWQACHRSNPIKTMCRTSSDPSETTIFIDDTTYTWIQGNMVCFDMKRNPATVESITNTTFVTCHKSSTGRE
ncbi:hypothetical protein DPMN_077316 [Dreissena polymorpha]|uniref:Uncharacterized protein n=1 Tax=Dreissena polymorpha TaxID=45954 RepID=A0A9D4BP83_DREPO|nr:hypothetical protein DPMN_077316 [Dreissena polymorpha]